MENLFRGAQEKRVPGETKGREDKRKRKSGREKEQDCGTDTPSCLRVQHLGKVLPRADEGRDKQGRWRRQTSPDSSA